MAASDLINLSGLIDDAKSAWCRDQGYGRIDPSPAWGQATRT